MASIEIPPITLSDALDELCMRFLNNLPESEYEEFERLFFAVEAAHWFYDDFHREENTKLPKLTLQAFAKRIFAHSPLLQPHAADVDALFARFRTYKHAVPTFGAAMLSPDLSNVLLVQAWGKSAKWGFPKGKIAKDETELEAAAREVYEETGFDFMTVLDPNSDKEPFFIDSYTGGKLCRIFVVPDVPEDTVFETRTRKEISNISWVPVAALPDPRPKNGEDDTTAASSKPNQHMWPSKSFWLVSQYVPKIRSYIKRRRKRGGAQSQRVQNPSLSASPQRPKKNNASGSCMSGGRSGRQGKGVTEANDFATRDDETFGAASLAADVRGGDQMTDGERDAFFRQYLADADRRKDELGIGDEFWPVPLVTSKDMPVSEAHAADVPVPVGSKGAKGLKPNSKAQRLNNRRKERPPPKLVAADRTVSRSPVTGADSQKLQPALEIVTAASVEPSSQPRTTSEGRNRQQDANKSKHIPFTFDRTAILACLA